MIEFEQRVEIDRPPAEVFALLSDIEQFPAWQRSVLFVVTPLSPLTVGAEFEQLWNAMGRSRRVPTRVAAYRPPELLAFAGDAGFMDFYCGFELIALGSSSTTLMSRNEFRLHSLWRILQPLIRWEMKRELANELTELKRLVEANASGGPRPGSRSVSTRA